MSSFRVRTDALFSYQPPFNLVAYATLLPLTRILSPRVFHTVNVFLIRLSVGPSASVFPSIDEVDRRAFQSLHILVAITVYERYFAPGSKFIESGKDTAYALFESLPKQIKNVSVLE